MFGSGISFLILATVYTYLRSKDDNGLNISYSLPPASTQQGFNVA